MNYRYRNESEMKDSGIEWLGNIPKGWAKKKLRNLGNISTSSVDKKINQYESLVKLVNYIDVYNSKNKELYNDELYMKVSAKDIQFKTCNLIKGDVLFTPSSETIHDIGYSAVVMEDLGNTLYSYHIVRLRFKEEIYLNYKKYMFWSNSFLNYLSSRATGTTRKTLSMNDFKDNIAVIPQQVEQEKIAKFLDEKTAQFDSVISKKEALIQRLEEAKKSLISEVVTGKAKVVKIDDGYKLVERKKEEMKDSGVEWLALMPKEWKRIKLARISNVVRGGSPRPAGDPKFFGGNEVPWITVAEVTKDENKLLDFVSSYLTQLGKRQSRYLEKGTLIMSNSGATLGVPKILNISGCINDGSLAFLNLDIDKNYLYYLLKSRTKIFREEMQVSGQPNLNTDVIKALDILKPLNEEQKLIAEYLDVKTDRINELIGKSKHQILKIKEAKQSLISEAVTGKIEIID